MTPDAQTVDAYHRLQARLAKAESLLRRWIDEEHWVINTGCTCKGCVLARETREFLD
jgi:hypothetical protein